MTSARRLIAQIVNTSSFACNDAGLASVVISPSLATRSARLR
jgi:hypothetical protein